MPTCEEAAIWSEVRIETLKRVHSSWLPGVPIDMLLQARRLALGRRWLAGRLVTASPVLFGRAGERDARSVARLKAGEWIAPLVADPWESALDLGSLAMSATLRSLINSPEILKIRGVLGPERYARILAWAGSSARPAPAPALGDLDMVERLIRCGSAEFAAFAAWLHPAWGESVRLTYERSWWLDAGAASLSTNAAQACLRRRIHVGVAALRTDPARRGTTTGKRH